MDYPSDGITIAIVMRNDGTDDIWLLSERDGTYHQIGFAETDRQRAYAAIDALAMADVPVVRRWIGRGR